MGFSHSNRCTHQSTVTTSEVTESKNQTHHQTQNQANYLQEKLTQSTLIIHHNSLKKNPTTDGIDARA
jgi:hypothetical protein